MNMTSERIDRVLLALGALLIAISSSQLFFRSSVSTEGAKLGTITSTLAVVKTKNALSLDWRDAAIGNDLSENQLIYTDNSSGAEVTFNEGNELIIGENSLVKLRSSVYENTMDLSNGFIRAKLEGNKPLKVQMNGADYLVSGNNADIQINLAEKRGEIGVLSGEIQVKKEDQVENLNNQTALEITGDKIQKKNIYFTVSSPKRSEVRYVLNTPVNVAFAWEPKEKAKVTFSRTLNFNHFVSYEGEGSLGLNLEQGLHYYRIENESGVSLLNSVRIIKETPPKIIRPLNGSEVSLLEGEDTLVLLQWRNDEKLPFLIEWENGESYSYKTSHDRATLDVKKDFPLRWRLRIESPERPEALWSPWQEIKLVTIPLPKIPQDLMPHEVEFQTYEAPHEKITFSWMSESPVEIEIEDPSKLVNSYKPQGNSFEYIATQGGSYQWRARAYDSYLRSSVWSDWKSFTVSDLSQEKNNQNIQRIQLKRPDQSVTFEWEAEAGSKSVFELSKDSGFQTIVKKVEVSKNSLQVSVPEIGEYYWRSRQYLADGTYEVSEPKKVIIEPVPAPNKPEKLPDLEVPLEEFPQKTSWLKSLLDFIIPSAHADEIRGVVKLDLPVKEEAKAYIVRIYRDKELTDLIYEEQLTSKEFVWANAEAGTFYWQYAVIDYWDRQSLFSDLATLMVKGEVVLPPEKPRLLSPIRAIEISEKDIALKWRDHEANVKYLVEISRDKNFRNIIAKKETKTNEASFIEMKWESGLYFWRVHALNKRGVEVLSNTARFQVKPPLEKIIITDVPPTTAWKKNWQNRAFIAWAPSMDSYTFKDGETGKIDGNALMGINIAGTVFKEKWTLSADLLRQSGEVFEGESYLFQRLLVDAVRTMNSNPHHKLTVGLAVGHTTGGAYSIGANDKVSSEPVSGSSYGPVLRNYLVFNQDWEMQGRAMYLLGEIKQIEVGADVIRSYKSYLILGGLSYSLREYKINSGEQTSLRVSLGIGKEF